MERLVAKYITRDNKRVRCITQPMHDFLGINYFTYHRIGSDGSYVVLVDRPDWAEHYVHNKFYEKDPFLRHPKYYQSGIASWNVEGAGEYQEEVLKSAHHDFGMNHGVSMIHKTSSAVEIFGFTSISPNSQLEGVIANDQSLFRSFGDYFKKQLAPILRQIKEEGVDLRELLGKTFWKDPNFCYSLTAIQREKMMQQQGMGDLVARAKKLSKRERQCLKLLLTNRTVGEIGDFLKLSRRTVEHYFENTKNKLGVVTRMELIQVTQKINDFQLLYEIGENLR